MMNVRSIYVLDCEHEHGESSRRAYERMIFDLCVELLHDVYSNNIQEAKYPEWQKAKFITKRFYRLNRPNNRDEAQRFVQAKILEILNLVPRQLNYSKWRTPSIRRQLEQRFEIVLDEEQRRTEPHWINYDEQRIQLTFDIADQIFKQILDETLVDCVSTINRRLTATSTTSA
jgi:hypothetical protein